MDRRPNSEGGGNAADDSIGVQAPPPAVSSQEGRTEGKDQSAHIAAGIMLASVGGDHDRTSVAASNGRSSETRARTALARLRHVLITFSRFVGPGFMVSVAYSKFHPSLCIRHDSDWPRHLLDMMRTRRKEEGWELYD